MSGFDDYLKHLELFPTCDDDEFAERFVKAKRGEPEALRLVLGSSLRIAWDVAAGFKELTRLNDSERIEEANAGVLLAWETFLGEEPAEYVEHVRSVIKDRLIRITLEST